MERIWKQASFAHFKAVIQKPQPLVTMETKSCTAAPNIWGSSVWKVPQFFLLTRVTIWFLTTLQQILH